MEILNLTQHIATTEQVKAGVFEPKTKEYIQKLLTFDELPSKQEIRKRAKQLASYTKLTFKGERGKAMIGGAPFLMSELEYWLRKNKIEPVYAFSKRVSVEKEVNGEVVKTNIFKHIGFVSPYKKERKIEAIGE